MLNTTQKILFTGESIIIGEAMEKYTAQIDINDPEKIILNRFIINKDGYRDNRDECQKDEAEFENLIYTAQAEMLSNNNKILNDN